MSKASYYIKRIIEEIKVQRVRRILDLSDITLLSQNCLGGVMYHDCGAKFLTPTVNLYMLPNDFMRFVNQYDKYILETPKIIDNVGYPVGEISNDVKINFMHYNTPDEAVEKWEQRKQRINSDKVFVICVERDGFDSNTFKSFKSLPYPKVLFTRNVEWKDDDECIFIKKYMNELQIPDLIPYRIMYYKNILPKRIKRAFK